MSAAPRLILLHPDDTILVCVTPAAAGDCLSIDGAEIVAAESVGVGHKIARRALAPGDKVVKYGAAIGSVTQHVEPGRWVHLHNMKSDYIASHSRETVAQGKG